jgi:hypothetical protein
VAGDDLDFVVEREQAGSDGVKDLGVVAAGEIGAADGALEEGVAGKDHVERDEMEADGALGVAGGVYDLSGKRGESDDGAVRERLVGRGGFGRGDAKPCGLLIHHGEQVEVVLIEENGRSGEALELERAADVVDVGVGDEDLSEGEAEGIEAAMNAGDFVAGIDDDCLAGLLIGKDGAVALERADGKGFEEHVTIVGRSGLRTVTAREAQMAEWCDEVDRCDSGFPLTAKFRFTGSW